MVARLEVAILNVCGDLNCSSVARQGNGVSWRYCGGIQEPCDADIPRESVYTFTK